MPLSGYIALDFHLDLGHQRCDGGDRTRDCESLADIQAGCFQRRADAFADRPQGLGSGKLVQSLRGEITDDLVETADQSLVRPEHQGPGRDIPGGDGDGCDRALIAQTQTQGELNRVLVLAERFDGLLILDNGGGGNGLHRAHHRTELLGSVELAAQACERVTHGLKGASAPATIWARVARSAAARGSEARQRWRKLSGICARAARSAASAAAIRCSGIASSSPPVSACSSTICSSTGIAANCGCPRQARIR